MTKRSAPNSPEVRERAVRKFEEHKGEQGSQYAAMRGAQFLQGGVALRFVKLQDQLAMALDRVGALVVAHRFGRRAARRVSGSRWC